VVVREVNGDGALDLVGANPSLNNASVPLNAEMVRVQVLRR